MITIQKYGWIPDHPDQRDLLYMAPQREEATPLPAKVDLRPHMPAIYDQGEIGSCVWNALVRMVHFLFILSGTKHILMPSRLFGYFNTRVVENSAASDSGCQIRDAIKSFVSTGDVSEVDWPYKASNVLKTPPKVLYPKAKLLHAVKYMRITSLNDMKHCLSTGYPVEIGISVYESFESNNVSKTGIVPMPGPKESLLGGHAITVVGYNDEKEHLICANSWGDGWGDHGYFYLPYTYITPELADDFWTIQSVSEVLHANG